jgi:hypothetical protein
VFDIQFPQQQNSQPLAYVVATGDSGIRFSGDVTEGAGTFHLAQNVLGPSISLTPAAAGPPVGYGSQFTSAGAVFTPNNPKADAVNLVSDGHGGLAPGFANSIGGH